jgi:hypothetical protein
MTYLLVKGIFAVVKAALMLPVYVIRIFVGR